MNEENYKSKIEEYIEKSKLVLDSLKQQSVEIVDLVAELVDTRERGGMVYVMGNGGSASTASHMVNDLQKTAMVDGQRRFRAISLNDNVPVMMAWANDSSYDVIFEEQLKNMLTANDMVIGISGSGNSKNVLRAINYANSIGAFTYGITGMGGGILSKNAKKSLVVKDDLMYRLEDIHLMINHIVVYAIKKTRWERD